MPIATHGPSDPIWRLHPELVAALDLLEVKAKAAGLPFRVSSGFRGFAYQARLYMAFRADPAAALRDYGVVARPAPMGVSRHHPFFDGKSVAVDLALLLPSPDKTKDQAALGALGEAAGLKWGGAWGDPVHFELRSLNGKLLDITTEYIRLGEVLDLT